LLLNLGLMAIAVKKRWHGLVPLGLLGTLFIEIGWANKFLTPEKEPIGLLVFLLFGLLYLFLPVLARQDEAPILMQSAAAGAAVPLLFALFLGWNQTYAGEWPLLFG